MDNFSANTVLLVDPDDNGNLQYMVILAHLKIFKVTFLGQGHVKVKQIN